MKNIIDEVKHYYGEVLRNKESLKTSACCPSDAMPAEHREILAQIEPEILDKFYGCGSPLPPLLKGKTVLDLGCGTGRDTYLAAYLAGENGRAIGVDMTEAQLEVARKYIYTQTERFGYSAPNMEFHQGYIENLQDVGIADNSVDVIISNCVLNLSPDKKQAFSEIFRVLKPGGELYFSDIFTGRRIPAALRDDPVLYGECLSGALYIEDFRRLLREIGILDYRVLSKRTISLDNPMIEAAAGMIDFYSMTIRAFKLQGLEDICEDYGQVAIYGGGIPEFPHSFQLDDHHIFQTGRPMLICGNTAAMIEETRYAPYFRVIGDRSVHYGAFDCSAHLSGVPQETFTGGACGC